MFVNRQYVSLSPENGFSDGKVNLDFLRCDLAEVGTR
jgi:hypothetical protein